MNKDIKMEYVDLYFVSCIIKEYVSRIRDFAVYLSLF